ncbi:MAG: hemerythrin domain-containing protein [Kofleriaceae bacterium]
MSTATPPPSDPLAPPLSRRALADLAAQHAALRDSMNRCEVMADELDARGGDPLPLVREVARLRLAFDAHNAYEEQLLRPVLVYADPHAETRIDRMVEDHVGEHRAVCSQLLSSDTQLLRDAIELLRAHLDAEERYLFTAEVLRAGTP